VYGLVYTSPVRFLNPFDMFCDRAHHIQLPVCKKVRKTYPVTADREVFIIFCISRQNFNYT